MTTTWQRRRGGLAVNALVVFATASAAMAVGETCGPACGHASGLAGLPADWTRTIIDHEPFPGARFAMARQFSDALRRDPTCFATGLTDEQRLFLLSTGGFGPAGDPAQQPTADQVAAGGVAPFYFSSGTVYRDGGTGNPWSLTGSGGANRIRLTYSFPADGVTWGTNSDRWSTGPNNLNAYLTGIFGTSNLDRGREWIRLALAAWRRSAAIDYDEVSDVNTAQNAVTSPQYGPGDVRIGGYPYGLIGVLAYNQFPASGSDMAINTSYSFNSSFNNYRYLRNTVSHEHGHGLGAIHPVPCNNTKIMEPVISTSFDALQIDDLRFAQRNYGDRFAGNRNATNARNFGDLTLPALRSVIEPDLSTNGRTTFTGGTASNATGVDWFRFTLSSSQTVTISVDPKGGTYSNDQQDGAAADICAGLNAPTVPTVNADNAGDLQFNVYQSNGTTLVGASTGGGPGVTETYTATLPAGTYTVRVWDGAASNAAADQIVQLYDLTIRVGASKAPPQVIAGINKRVQANTNAQFLGNVLTRVTEAGATIPSNGYAWDLDGDGATDSTITQPQFVYTSNGTYPVTLRVTDSNGSVGTDSINVTVFGATTSVSGNSPSSATQGQTVPITINGNNFKLVTAASQVSVSGTGVTVTGTPVSNARGTQLTGLSLVVAPNATIGNRTITVSNSAANGGAATGGVFTILSGVACPVITAQPAASVVAYAGLPFTLSAAATPPEATFEWLKDGQPIPGATSPTLTIDPAQASDAGTYRLRATTACGQATSDPAVVSFACTADYNADTFVNLDDLGDFISDYYTATPVPGGLQADAPSYPGAAVGYGRPCPAAGDAPAPYAADAYRAFGYRVGYSSDGTNACPIDALAPFPNLDNLGDFISMFYSAAPCP